jgi:hypothetical protein
VKESALAELEYPSAVSYWREVYQAREEVV